MNIIGLLGKLFLYVLQYSFYAAVIAIVIIIIRALLSRKMPAIFSYALWGVVLIRLLFPFQLPIPSIMNQVNQEIDSSISVPIVPSDSSAMINQDIDENKIEQSSQAILTNENQNKSNVKQIHKEASSNHLMIIGVIWLMGISILFSQTILSYLITYRRLKSAVRFNKFRLVKQCAELARVKYNEGIYISNQFNVPVLFGTLRPKIILPLIANKLTETELKHVILHEMIHKKRCDMWMNVLWAVALFINWFNPILWIVHHFYSRDMERACDEKVIQILGMDKKKLYALSLMKIALNMNKKNLCYEALAFSKGNVKQRVKNVLSLKKYSKAIILFSLVLVLMISTILLTACQPTPEGAIIPNKDGNTLESAIAASALPTTNIQITDTHNITNMVVNTHWTDNVASELTTVEIDADVVVPNVTAYPVFDVTPLVVEKGLAEKFVNALTKNADSVYNGSYLSKEECEEEILRIQRDIAEIKAGKLPPDDDRSADEQIEDLENQLERMKIEYAKIENEDVVGSSPDYTFEQDLFSPERQSILLKAKMKDGSIKLITLTQCEENMITYSELNMIDKNWGELSGSAISEAQAREIAFDLIKELDIGDFDLASENVYDSYNELIFFRSYNGIPITSINNSDGNSSGVGTEAETTYSFVLTQECMRIAIDNTGIILVNWISPCTVLQTSNENVALLSLDEIKEIFKQQILYNVYEADGEEDTVQINEVRLGYMVIPEKNNLSSFRTILVWDFIGPLSTDQEEIEEAGSYGIDLSEPISYLTINAIDGTIIDRNLGY